MSAPDKVYINHGPSDGELRVYSTKEAAITHTGDTGWSKAVEYVRADILSADEVEADRQADEACDKLVAVRKELEAANERVAQAEAGWQQTRNELQQAQANLFKTSVSHEALAHYAANLTQQLQARS